MAGLDLLVCAFGRASLYTLTFYPPRSTDPKGSLQIVKDSPAISGNNWLSLSPRPERGSSLFGQTRRPDVRYLYASGWGDKPAVAAYRIRHSGREIDFMNAKPVRALPGYTCVSGTHVYAVGGPTGEVFALEADGSIGALVQELSFVGEETSQRAENDIHGQFGGLRHGSHSVDLSPDGNALYVADIGRNCIWTFRVNKTPSPLQQVQIGLEKNQWTKGGMQDAKPHLELTQKLVASRPNDGPRHTWPHPNGKVLYCVHEHSSMVDVYELSEQGSQLKHIQGVKVIPSDKDVGLYWADEVRLSTTEPGSNSPPQYLYASTRGLRPETMGYVAAFAIEPSGLLSTAGPYAPSTSGDVLNNAVAPITVWETPTSGGLANAIEPAPWRSEFEGREYLAMTDSHEGLVLVLGFDGKAIREIARVCLGKDDDGKVIGAATAVWF